MENPRKDLEELIKITSRQKATIARFIDLCFIPGSGLRFMKKMSRTAENKPGFLAYSAVSSIEAIRVGIYASAAYGIYQFHHLLNP